MWAQLGRKSGYHHKFQNHIIDPKGKVNSGLDHFFVNYVVGSNQDKYIEDMIYVQLRVK